MLGLTWASCWWLATRQNLASLRSLAWNGALPVLEAGVEEAFTQLRYTGITNLSANGWTDLRNGWFFKKRLVDQSSFFEVLIRKSEPPIIVSTGYVPAPSGDSERLLGSLRPSAVTSLAYVKRSARIDTARDCLFRAAILAQGRIEVEGGRVATDGFDSTDSRYSTRGRYDPARARATGDLGTTSREPNALSLGDAAVRGHVATGPGATVALSALGTIGDGQWVGQGTDRIQPGWEKEDLRVVIPEVRPPFQGDGLTPAAGRVGNTHYDFVLDHSANYQAPRLSGRVLVTAQATLWVTDSVRFGSGDFISIAPGASLRLYVSAPEAVIGGVLNADGAAGAFQYYGLPSNTALSLHAGEPFIGVVYAPQAVVSLSGVERGADPEFTGAFVVHDARIHGPARIHFDEALRAAFARGYVASAWHEIDPNAPIR